MWNTSLIDGPIPAPIYAETGEVIDGVAVFEIIGEEPGYRLNVAPTVMSDALEPFRVTPGKRLRTFAGAQTYRLLFADEAEARLYLPEYWFEAEG